MVTRQYGYGVVTLEGYKAFASVLDAAPWSNIPVSSALLTGNVDPAVMTGMAVLPWCRMTLLRAVQIATNITHGGPVVTDLDAAWDNNQTRLDLFIAAAERSPVPAEQAAGTRLRATLLPNVGPQGVTHLSYVQEVDYGRAQQGQAALPDVHADIVLLGLSSVVAQASSATKALADAIATTTGPARKTTVSTEQRVARQGCTHAFSVVHDILLTALAMSADGPARTTMTALFQTLSDLLSHYPGPRAVASATTPTHPTATTPATPTGNADVTIVPAGTATPTTPVTPGAAAPQAPVQAPVTAPTAPRRARKTPKAVHTRRARSTAKPVRKPTKKTPATAKKRTKKK